MPKALAFGAFDGLHPGHRHYLDQAAAYGDLTVVLGRDEVIAKIKGRPPLRDERTRLKALQDAGYHAVLGSLTDRYAVFAEVRPDFVCLGYDQKADEAKIAEVCSGLGLSATIVRIGAHEPHRYKSSIIDRHETPDRHQ